MSPAAIHSRIRATAAVKSSRGTRGANREIFASPRPSASREESPPISHHVSSGWLKTSISRYLPNTKSPSYSTHPHNPPAGNPRSPAWSGVCASAARSASKSPGRRRFPRTIPTGSAAITETGRAAPDGGFPALSKNTSPSRCRSRAATSTGVMPLSRTGFATGRAKDSAIAGESMRATSGWQAGTTKNPAPADSMVAKPRRSTRNLPPARNRRRQFEAIPLA